jgi:pimeloyl-ACP methyl ester carboxylesterase
MRWSFLVFAAALVTTSCAYEVTEKNFLFPRQTLTPTTMFEPCERSNVEIPVGDGVRLRGWAFTSPSNERWVIWFYGNTQSVFKTIQQQDALFRIFRANVVAVDYRGYGFSDGEPTLEQIAADALVTYDHVSANLAHGLPIFVVGHSLGTIPALAIASKRPVAGTVLMSTVTSPQDALDVVVHAIPWWQRIWIRVYLAPALRDLKPTTADLVSRVKGPLLMIHGTDDELFPIEHVRRLFDLAPATQKTFCSVDHATHQETIPSSSKTRDCLDGFVGAFSRAARAE